MKKVKIHLARINKPTRTFEDVRVDDNGIRLKTFTRLPERISRDLSESFFQSGRICSDARIKSVVKYLFYDESFDIMAFQDPDGKVLGYYCDITTPLRKEGSDYYLLDLILDLWIFPDLSFTVLDMEEWQNAIHAGFVDEETQRDAERTLERLKSEIRAGKFPEAYVTG
jgi:predicted RNA-binding protein associated with RNAse of E/G family